MAEKKEEKPSASKTEQKPSPDKTAKNPDEKKSGNGCLTSIMIAVIVVIVLGFLGIYAGAYFFWNRVGSKLKENGVQINQTNGGVSLQNSKTGETMNIGGAAQIPDSFPKSFPIYPGAQSAAVMTDKESVTISFSVKNASAADVITWYKEAFPKNGWTIKTNDAGMATVLEFQNATNTGLVTVISQNKDALLTVTMKTK